MLKVKALYHREIAGQMDPEVNMICLKRTVALNRARGFLIHPLDHGSMQTNQRGKKYNEKETWPPSSTSPG